VTNADGALRDLLPTLLDVADHMKASGGSTETLANVSRVLGGRSIGLRTALESLADGGFSKARVEAEKYNAVIDAEAAKKMADYKDATDRLGLAYQSLIGIPVATWLADIIEQADNLFRMFKNDGVVAVKVFVKSAISTMLELSPVINNVLRLFGKSGDDIASALDPFKSAIRARRKELEEEQALIEEMERKRNQSKGELGGKSPFVLEKERLAAQALAEKKRKETLTVQAPAEKKSLENAKEKLDLEKEAANLAGEKRDAVNSVAGAKEDLRSAGLQFNVQDLARTFQGGRVGGNAGVNKELETLRKAEEHLKNIEQSIKENRKNLKGFR